MLDRGYVDTYRLLNPGVTKYSFWAARGNDLRGRDLGWRLDYMLIDKANVHRVIDSTIHKEFVGSDHCPTQIKLDLSKEAILPKVSFATERELDASSVTSTQMETPHKP